MIYTLWYYAISANITLKTITDVFLYAYVYEHSTHDLKSETNIDQHNNKNHQKKLKLCTIQTLNTKNYVPQFKTWDFIH